MKNLIIWSLIFIAHLLLNTVCVKFFSLEAIVVTQLALLNTHYTVLKYKIITNDKQ
jgi:hypothetical protein